ncbi:G/U mismatch-specific DNA glycosylase [Frankia sp. CNm7]|uniref:G/U mismatch-specific DNA glycosylase n=1 Tax=Frankia nepalensis TaxID=1836974 RepID=A0A937RAF6_9ACTN|nr:G/U mismatch-specific DNA glycosylase [Frankia nepalensis]MBL7501547.1 G/U mismatch-specific DNA glycosylase [Frankia nepalensis]MBL7515566.1 G/U mismatch-specific DNA glycosylase [Frankia nepalensis]MBL7518912.1 G/U mismatch-specific DNA glycosylase [Frankia nepalensis]MBL7626707.1 G/U mismatch-specific DNA glycosylase [Frankia nepalensis]
MDAVHDTNTATTATGAVVADPRRKPTKSELQAAYGRAVPDLLAPGLKVLICGINPSLAAGATGFHFGGAANRLWATLHQAGFTDRQLHPSETDELLAHGIGITNIVNRATARADEIGHDEIRAGVGALTALVDRVQPAWLAFLGLGAYRVAFDRRKATVGRQPERLGSTGVWLLPNPSGLNAHYSLPALAAAYRELRETAYPAQAS